MISPWTVGCIESLQNLEESPRKVSRTDHCTNVRCEQASTMREEDHERRQHSRFFFDLNGSYIEDRTARERMWMKEEGAMFMLRMWVLFFDARTASSPSANPQVLNGLLGRRSDVTNSRDLTKNCTQRSRLRQVCWQFSRQPP